MKRFIIPYNTLRQCISGHRKKIIHDYSEWGNELIIVFEGSATFQLDDLKFNINKGDVFLLTGDYIKEIHDAEDLNMCSIFYRDVHLQRSAASFRRLEGYQQLFVESPMARDYSENGRLQADEYLLQDLINLIERMEIEQQLREPGFEQVLNSTFFIMITLISRAYSAKEVFKEKSNSSILHIMAYIKSNFDEPLSITSLAEMANLSHRHFNRKFKEMFDISPGQLIRKLRIERACFLLEESELTMLEIAMECGFMDSNYFSKTFRELVNMSPTQYRKLRLNEIEQAPKYEIY